MWEGKPIVSSGGPECDKSITCVLESPKPASQSAGDNVDDVYKSK